MSKRIKRSDFQTFLNTTPATTATYVIMGDGITSAKIQFNPKVTSEVYIDRQDADISVDSYAPNFPVQAIAKDDDAIFDYIETLLRSRAVLTDCETDLINVWAYDTGGPTAYPAEKQLVSIQIDDFGGDGGVVNKINFTINYQGNPIPGTFNASTKTFTPS